MQVQEQEREYTVRYTAADASLFGRDNECEEVEGSGHFTFRRADGEILAVGGSAVGRYSSPWYAFAMELEHTASSQCYGISTYDHVAHMPEFVVPGHPYELTLVKVGGQIGVIVGVLPRDVSVVRWENGTRNSGHGGLVLANPGDVARIVRPPWPKLKCVSHTAKRGWQPWIQRRGKLGRGFLTAMTTRERHRALDDCVRVWGYRSCLGSILALERARRGPLGTGQGVGALYEKRLAEAREYLRREYGGEGSFGPQRRKAETAPNPPTKGQEQQGALLLWGAADGLRRAQRQGPERCDTARTAYRMAQWAQREALHAAPDDAARAERLQSEISLFLDDHGCSWFETSRNPEPEEHASLAREDDEKARELADRARSVAQSDPVEAFKLLTAARLYARLSVRESGHAGKMSFDPVTYVDNAVAAITTTGGG